MIYYNCQKSYIYFVEFIGQIGDDNHSFLQLNSKDASLFVYKKTLFEINNDVKQNLVYDETTNKTIHDINLLIEIYNVILDRLIDNNTIIEVIKNVNTDLFSIMQKIIKIYIEGNNQDISYKINSILIFCNNFKNENIIDYLEIFIKKIRKKKNINLRKLELYLLDEELYNNVSHVKYINNLMNHIE